MSSEHSDLEVETDELVALVCIQAEDCQGSGADRAISFEAPDEWFEHSVRTLKLFFESFV